LYRPIQLQPQDRWVADKEKGWGVDLNDLIASLQDAQKRQGNLSEVEMVRLAAELHGAAVDLWGALPAEGQTRKTVLVKVDGSERRGGLHQRTAGWQDGRMYGPPVPGAVEGVRALLDAGFAVVAQSIRLNQESVAAWLRSHGIEAVASDGRPLMYWNGPEVLCTRQTISYWGYYGPRSMEGPWPEVVQSLIAMGGAK
jgi:hypothetical protein